MSNLLWTLRDAARIAGLCITGVVLAVAILLPLAGFLWVFLHSVLFALFPDLTLGDPSLRGEGEIEPETAVWVMRFFLAFFLITGIGALWYERLPRSERGRRIKRRMDESPLLDKIGKAIAYPILVFITGAFTWSLLNTLWANIWYLVIVAILLLMCVHFETENFRETLSSFSKATSQRSQFGRILDLKRNAH